MLPSYSIGLIVQPGGLSAYQRKCLQHIVGEHEKAAKSLTIKVPGFKISQPQESLSLELREFGMRCQARGISWQVGPMLEGPRVDEVLMYLKDCDELYGFPVQSGMRRLHPDRVWSVYRKVEAMNEASNSTSPWRAGVKIIQPWYNEHKA